MAVTKIWIVQKEGQYQAHLAVDAHCMPLRVIITKGTTADCSQADALLANINADNLLADRCYDSGHNVELATSQGMNAIIPPRRNLNMQRKDDKELYKLRI